MDTQAHSPYTGSQLQLFPENGECASTSPEIINGTKPSTFQKETLISCDPSENSSSLFLAKYSNAPAVQLHKNKENSDNGKYTTSSKGTKKNIRKGGAKSVDPAAQSATSLEPKHLSMQPSPKRKKRTLYASAFRCHFQTTQEFLKFKDSPLVYPYLACHIRYGIDKSGEVTALVAFCKRLDGPSLEFAIFQKHGFLHNLHHHFRTLLNSGAYPYTSIEIIPEAPAEEEEDGEDDTYRLKKTVRYAKNAPTQDNRCFGKKETNLDDQENVNVREVFKHEPLISDQGFVSLSENAETQTSQVIPIKSEDLFKDTNSIPQTIKRNGEDKNRKRKLEDTAHEFSLPLKRCKTPQRTFFRSILEHYQSILLIIVRYLTSLYE